MKMTDGSWRIYAVAFNERTDGLSHAYVTADMLEVGREWPSVIVDGKGGKSFQFVCNELMQDWMIGNYSGHAKYVEIRAV